MYLCTFADQYLEWMKEVESIQPISKQYDTAERPVLVRCSDMNRYVCKYNASSGSPNKLFCELLGAFMGNSWGLAVPEQALVTIKREHIPEGLSPSFFATPCVGSRFREGVTDVTRLTFGSIPKTEQNIEQLALIALFDLWLANEDRNYNNCNLLYDILNNTFIPIDHGSILNTATMDFPLSQLTSTDTLLYTDLFKHVIQQNKDFFNEEKLLFLKKKFYLCIKACKATQEELKQSIPSAWNIRECVIQKKLAELFQDKWLEDTWGSFNEFLKDNIENEEPNEI